MRKSRKSLSSMHTIILSENSLDAVRKNKLHYPFPSLYLYRTLLAFALSGAMDAVRALTAVA